MSKKGIVVREDVLNRLRKLQEELSIKAGRSLSLDEVITYLMDSTKEGTVVQRPAEREEFTAQADLMRHYEKAQARENIAEAMRRIADLLGERIRDSCRKYDKESGMCTWYELYEIPDDFRNAFPDLFVDSNGKTRFFVGENPWICALCRKGRV